MKIGPSLTRNYALAVEACADAVRRASSLEKKHAADTAAMRAELEGLRAYREFIEDALLKLAQGRGNAMLRYLKTLGLLRGRKEQRDFGVCFNCGKR